MNSTKRIVFLSFIVFSLILMGIGTISKAEAASGDTIHYYGVVDQGPLNVRSGPGTSYDTLGKVAVGTKITITGTTVVNNVKWYLFTFESHTAYVCGTYIKLTASQLFYAAPVQATVIAEPLNVRSGPGISYAILGTASEQKVINVQSLYHIYGVEKWLRITWNGKKAYVSARYVALNTSGLTVTIYPNAKYGVATAELRARTGPSTAYSVVGQPAIGTSFSLLGETTNAQGQKWYFIEYKARICYISAKYISFTPPQTSQNAQKIINLAMSKVGSPYVYGNEGPTSFDCSGFVYWVVNNSGISGLSVPRTSDILYLNNKDNNIGTNIANAKPADIILFSTDGTVDGISHSAIYLGGGKMIHASNSTTGVIISDVSYSTTNKSLFAIIRLPGVW